MVQKAVEELELLPTQLQLLSPQVDMLPDKHQSGLGEIVGMGDLTHITLFHGQQ
jgi:hypothetical protein